MGLVSLTELLSRARRQGYALGYFESWDSYSLEAALDAAEAARSPAILGFGGAVTNQAWLDGHGVEELAGLARCLSERATVPTAVLYNEARTLAQVQRALGAGCNAVMLDTSHLPYEENLALTQEVVRVAHAMGAAVEAELGHLADASVPRADEAVCTDPAQAARFVERTGVDALAVSIGNMHILLDAEAQVDLALLTRIHRQVSVPLVLHGGTGFPPHAVQEAIRQGVSKFNVGTRLKRAFLEGVRMALEGLPERPNYHLYVGSREPEDILNRGKAGVRDEIVPLLRLYGCAGRADEGASTPQ